MKRQSNPRRREHDGRRKAPPTVAKQGGRKPDMRIAQKFALSVIFSHATFDPETRPFSPAGSFH